MSGLEDATLRRGQVVRQTYTVDRLLGRGGFADVYLVRHRFMGMQAMKVFRDPVLEEEKTLLGEAFLLAKFGHPNIVRVFEANLLDDGDREYLTMEYVAGSTLGGYAAERGTPTLRRCLEIVCQVAAGLAQAHAHDPPIVHRDIKPQNVLVAAGEGRPRVKLGDFGLAVPIRRWGDRVEPGGTLLYMSPEALDGLAGPPSDVYSLGLVLYELICGFLPWPHALFASQADLNGMIGRLREAHDRPIRPPSWFRSEVPEELDEILLRALARDPRERHADAGELFAALDDYRIRTAGAPRATRLARLSPTSEAAALVERAYHVARQVAALPLAVEILEQAVSLDPALRAIHGEQLERWRRGIAFHMG